MNKIKIFMSEDDYCKGFKFKLNKLGFKEKSNIVFMIILSTVITVLTTVLKLDYFAYIVSAVFMLTAVMMTISPTKKSLIGDYHTSPFTKKEKSILFDDYKISFISSFEKVEMLIEDIFAYEIDNDSIIIQPIASSEFYVINKSKNQGFEVDKLCELLKSKCKKINVSNNTYVTESEISNPHTDETDVTVPFSFETQITHNDCIENQKLAVRRNRSMAANYVFIMFYIAFGAYSYITSRDIKMLITIFIIAASIAILALYNNFIAVRIMAKKVEKNDKFGSLKRHITVNSSFIETVIESAEKNVNINRVIPFGYISIAMENEKYISIIAGSESHIFIPKRYLTAEMNKKLTEILTHKCRYIKMK